ncbi:MAG: hypothetical protein U0Z26_08785 [Anaerolineales bacterium]
MTEETKDDPAKKMRKLLNGGKASPMMKLPKKDGASVSFLPKNNGDKKQDEAPKKPSVDLKAAIQPKKEPSAPKKKISLPSFPKPALLSKGIKLNFGPPFWTIASVISMSVNVILLIVLLALMVNLSSLNIGGVMNMGNFLLGGLYTNFEKMDRANITTNVKVDTTIPVKFDLQLNQQTNVVLSQDVTITNALVTVNTGGLNISRANTTIVLPQGTNLPVVLNLTVPVDTTVPVTLNVPVDIPLAQTQLHEPFSGLQDVVKPFYCMLNSGALNLDNQPICQ